MTADANSRLARTCRGLAACSIAFVLLAVPAGLRALEDDIAAALRAEIEKLQGRIEQLEARLETEVENERSTPAVGSGAVADLTALREPEPRRPLVQIGGRIKLDTIVNSVSAGGASSNKADLAFVPGAIPVVGNGEDDQVKFSARNSRLWFKASTPNPLGDVAAYIEFDFFSSDTAGTETVTNGYTPRLRHGYGEWRGWLGGQTFSTLVNLRAYPEINDDGAPMGAPIVRQPMVRWSGTWGRHELMLALESPESIIRDRSGARLTPDDERLPDFVARYIERRLWGQWSLAGIVREIRIDQGGVEDTAVGGGLSASGLVRVGEWNDVRFSASAGNALGRYLSTGFFDDARIDTDGALELIPSGGSYLAYRHWWSRHWRSNAVLSGSWMNRDGAHDNENEWGYSLHANLLWSPMLTTSLGVEWIQGERHLVDGRDGVLSRLQFTAIHKF